MNLLLLAQEAVADPAGTHALTAAVVTLTGLVVGGGFISYRKFRNGGGAASRATQESHTKLLEDRRQDEIKMCGKLDDIKDGIGDIKVSCASLAAGQKATDERVGRIDNRVDRMERRSEP